MNTKKWQKLQKVGEKMQKFQKVGEKCEKLTQLEHFIE